MMASSWWKQRILRQKNGDFCVSGTISDLGSVPDCIAGPLPSSLLPLAYKREIYNNAAPFCRRCWGVIWPKHLKCEYWDRQQNSFTCLIVVAVVVPRMVCHTEEVVQQGEELSVYLLHSGWDLTLFWKETALPWGRLGMFDMDKVMEFRVKQADREREQEWAVNREPVVQHQGERHLGEVSDLPTCRRNRPRAKL